MVQIYEKRKLTNENIQQILIIFCLFQRFFPSGLAYGAFLCLMYYPDFKYIPDVNWLQPLTIVLIYLLNCYLHDKTFKISNQPKQLIQKLQSENGNFEHQKLQVQESQVMVMQSEKHQKKKQSQKVQLMPYEIRQKNDKNSRPQKYHCNQCNITLPFRARHCVKCGLCTLKFDHHCFWVGNCIGQNNHRQYISILLLFQLNTILIFNYSYKVLQYVTQWYFTWPSYLCLVMLLVTALYSCYLLFKCLPSILRGSTLWQAQRRNRISYLNYLNKGYNPFDMGIVKNLKAFITNNYPSYMKKGQQWIIPTYGQAENLYNNPCC